MTAFRIAAAVLSLMWVISTAWAETTLAPKLEPGTSFKSKETTKTRQMLKLGGQAINSASDTVIVSQTKIGQRNEQGGAALGSHLHRRDGHRHAARR